MKRYSNKRTAYIAIENNSIIAFSRTITDFSKQLKDIGKGRLFYNRQFIKNDIFQIEKSGRIIFLFKKVF